MFTANGSHPGWPEGRRKNFKNRLEKRTENPAEGVEKRQGGLLTFVGVLALAGLAHPLY